MRGRDAVGTMIADVESCILVVGQHASYPTFWNGSGPQYGRTVSHTTPSIPRFRRPLLPIPNPGASAENPPPSNSSTAILPLVLVLVWLSDPDLTHVCSSKSNFESIILGNGELFLRVAVRPRGTCAIDQSNTFSTLLRLSIRLRSGDSGCSKLDTAGLGTLRERDRERDCLERLRDVPASR